MKIGIYLEVKFRALGITFGHLRQAFRVGPGVPTLIEAADIPKPEDAQKVFDQRGVKIWAWPLLG